MDFDPSKIEVGDAIKLSQRAVPGSLQHAAAMLRGLRVDQLFTVN